MLWVTISIALVGKSRRCPDAEQFRAEVLGGEHVERGERFVHQQHVRFDHERTGEPHSLAHAPGEFLRVGGLEAVETDLVDGPLGPFAARLGQHAPCFEAELDVLADGQPRQQRKGLEHHRHAGVGAGERSPRYRTRPEDGGMSPAMQRRSVRLAGS